MTRTKEPIFSIFPGKGTRKHFWLHVKKSAGYSVLCPVDRTSLFLKFMGDYSKNDSLYMTRGLIPGYYVIRIVDMGDHYVIDPNKVLSITMKQWIRFSPEYDIWVKIEKNENL